MQRVFFYIFLWSFNKAFFFYLSNILNMVFLLMIVNIWLSFLIFDLNFFRFNCLILSKDFFLLFS